MCEAAVSADDIPPFPPGVDSTAHHPEVADIRDLLTFRLTQLAGSVDRLGQRWLTDEYGMRILEWRVLGLVAAWRPVRFNQIAQALALDKGQLSRTVTVMAERGWITRDADPGDQRTFLLDLTEAGAALNARLLARARARNENVVSALSQQELGTLFALLDKLQPHMARRAETEAQTETEAPGT